MKQKKDTSSNSKHSNVSYIMYYIIFNLRSSHVACLSAVDYMPPESGESTKVGQIFN